MPIGAHHHLLPVRSLSIADPAAPIAPPTDDTSILLVARHALVRAGLRAVLGATPGLAVVGEAAEVSEAVAAAERLQPDVVLLSAAPESLGDRDGVAALRARAPGACVLYLGGASGAGDDTLACVPTEAGLTEFCATVGELLGGRCAACALRAQCPAPRLEAALSRRERQVAVRVAAGLTTKQIAATLGVSVRTVNTYRESLARKVGASSASVLTRYVLEHGLGHEADGRAG